MGLPVNAPSEQLAAQSVVLLRNFSNTRQTVLYPSGAVTLALSYRLLPGATATASQFLRYCTNASSDADAAGKLATDNAFGILLQGDDKVLSAASTAPITRLDVVTSAAVGTEVTLLEITAGVLT